MTCHWPATICGVGDATVIQLPDARFVLDCTVKPADASGQVRVRFVGVVVALMLGLIVLKT